MSATRRAVLLSSVSASLVLASAGPGWAATSADYTGVRTRLAGMLTGATNYNPAVAPYSTIIADTVSHATALRSTMDTTPGTYLWNDAMSGTGEVNTRISFDRLRVMALAYSTVGSSLQGNSGLLADIVTGLQWLSTNRYNTSLSQTGNWWEWQIGAPLSILDILCLLKTNLGASLVNALCAAVDHFAGDPNASSGANKVWMAHVKLVRAVIVEDEPDILSAITSLKATFPAVTSGDGFYDDNSFVQHAEFSYTGGYGRDMLFRTAGLIYALHGSIWALTTSEWSRVRDWLNNCFAPLMYRGAMMDATRGRVISRANSSDLTSGQSSIYAALYLGTIYPAGGLKSLAKYWLAAEAPTFDFYQYDENSIYRVNPDLARLAKAIVADSGVTASAEPSLCYVFPRMDRISHRRPTFAVNVAMHSTRIANFEAINGENLKGWYTGHGMTYLYTPSYPTFSDDYWPTVDPYRLPGTTIDKRPRANGATASTNGQAVVGMVEVGTSGSACMQLSTDGNTLSGRKSWFMIGDYVVAMGSAITNSVAYAVETIVENRNIGASGTNVVRVDDTTTTRLGSLGASETYSNANWAHIEDVGGFVFPGAGVTLKGKREARSGKWSDINTQSASPTDTRTRRYVTLWLDHGVNPAAASYAYIMLPGRTAAETASWAAGPQISIVHNTANVHNVTGVFSTVSLYAANFWTSSSIVSGVFTANAPVCIAVRATATTLEISLSDPTQVRTTAVTVQVRLSNTGLTSADSGLSVSRTASEVNITFNPTNTRGSTRTAVLSR